MKSKITLTLLFAFLIGIANYSSFAQESTTSNKEQKKIEKEQKKQEKALKSAQEREELFNLLKNKCFVFRVSRLQGDRGDNFSVPPDRNFLIIEDTLVMYQFAFDNVVGWNGVGGATMKGHTTNYEYNDPGGNKALTVSARITPIVGQGNSRFNMTIRDSGDGNLTLILGDGTQLQLTGRLVSPEEAGINIGTSPF